MRWRWVVVGSCCDVKREGGELVGGKFALFTRLRVAFSPLVSCPGGREKAPVAQGHGFDKDL